MVLRGYGAASMRPDFSPIETYIPMWPWGEYLGEGALERGVDVCVSSWNRPAPNTIPSGAKSAGNYILSTLMVMEATAHGYAEAIGLGPGGLVSEGSGQNLFLVMDGEVVTPILDGTSLWGITRHSVLKIAEELGLTVRQQLVPREMLYSADEMFFTGTASEVTPIRSGRRAADRYGPAGAGDGADPAAVPGAGERRGAGSVGVADVPLIHPAASSASTDPSSTLTPRVMSSGR